MIFQQRKFGLIWLVGSFLEARILMKTKGYPCSNLGRWFQFGRRWRIFLLQSGLAKAERRGCRGRRLERAQARPVGHQIPFQFFLCDLGYERNSFYPLIVAKTGHKRRPMGRQLRQRLSAVRSFSSKALASRSGPTSSLWHPLASRPVQWFQSAMNSSRRLGFGGF
jgi:hypothetical protein